MRRQAFEAVVGPEHAQEVNALFESKLLLKNQKEGLKNWARQLADVTPAVKKDIVDRINDMEDILNPGSQQSFYEDLAKKKLGFAVTSDEAKTIFDQAQNLEQLKQVWDSNLSDIQARRAYGRAKIEFMDNLQKMKPDSRSFGERFINAALQFVNIPRAIEVLGHLSAPGVQMWGQTTTLAFWTGIPKMIYWFASEENFKDFMADLITHPLYDNMRAAGLGLVDAKADMSLRDEFVQSKLLEDFNQYLKDKSGGYIPNLARASTRGFTGYQNYVRVSAFEKMYHAFQAQGHDVSLGSETVRMLAREINNFTGYGAIGVEDKFRSATPLLNMILFTSRKTSATINMFNPIKYINPYTPWVVRQYAIKRLLGSLAVTAGITTLANQMGYGVDVNPISQDFMKVEINGQKFDITGGNAIYLRLLARLIMNKEITAQGKELEFGEGYKPHTRMDEIIRFWRGKLNSTAGTLVDAFYGTDPVGRPFSVSQEARDKLLPISFNAFLNYYQNNPENTAALIPSLSVIFGWGMESPRPARFHMFGIKSGINVWGEPTNPWFPAPRNILDKELERLNVPVNLPYPSINGHKLTDDQYKSYISKTGYMARRQLLNLIDNPKWQQIPDSQKIKIIQGTMKASRKFGMNSVMGESMNSGNDLFKKTVKTGTR